MSGANTPAIIDLGHLPYAEAYEVQLRHMQEVLDARANGTSDPGRLLLVEHPHVLTVTRRPTAAGHVLASAEHLAQLGVEVCPTDRGGDVTYHGPGQVVIYPILDLESRRLRIGDYLRLLEQAVIDCCADAGLATVRDTTATGVWTKGPAGEPTAKVCAIGVRVKRWVSLHGLAVNVSTDLRMFELIVPCGLVGRPVTSLKRELGERAPTAAVFGRDLALRLAGVLTRQGSEDGQGRDGLRKQAPLA